MWDCLGLAYGLFDGKSMVQEKVLELISPLEKGAQDVVLFSVAHCHKDKEVINHRRNQTPNECDALAGKYMLCIKNAMFYNCPAEYWKIEPLCDEFDSGVPLCD
ncbi:uncharacterized protein LOC129744935 [Uranotaenia lowii]|uniref:uncharacterized protein LOC129744935 n=1 Tax=Uranotaenia lowii TaxID=190385 RepID=UPI0024791BF5|nr:uncharacterized protein LOC129744935 [Uranotaenia lowii]